jgi:hypothetical protein
MQSRVRKYLQRRFRTKQDIFITIDNPYVINIFFFKSTNIYSSMEMKKLSLLKKKEKSAVSIFVNYKL